MFAESVDLLAAAEDWRSMVPESGSASERPICQGGKNFADIWSGTTTNREDELFYVLRGNLTIEYEGGRAIHLKTGSIHVVPKGNPSQPDRAGGCWIALIETATTKHTGDVNTPLTKTVEQQLTAR